MLVSKVRAFASTTETDLDDLALTMLHASKTFFFLAAAIYAGLTALELPGFLHLWAKRIFIGATIVQVGFWGTSGIDFWAKRHIRRTMNVDAASVTTVGLLGFVARVALFTMLVLLGLNNLGIDITALVAGLNVGGIALALAVQNILGDLFASLTIVLDKPFAVGDFITVGDLMGTVEHVGLKTTRLRSLSGEELVFANADLLQSRIRNYKRMKERHVVFQLGVVYDTDHGKVRLIPQIIRGIIESEQPLARFERCHFSQFGDSALQFETVYWITNSEYQVYMEAQQRIFLAILEKFRQERIDFAFPTQTLVLQQGVVSGIV